MAAPPRVVARASRGEKLVLAVFLALLTLWMLPGALAIVASAHPTLEPSSRAVLAYPRSRSSSSSRCSFWSPPHGRGLLTFREVAEGIHWKAVFMFGDGLAMASALEASGFSRWISLAVAGSAALDKYSLSTIGCPITLPASNTAAPARSRAHRPPPRCQWRSSTDPRRSECPTCSRSA